MSVTDKLLVKCHFEEVKRLFFPRWDKGRKWMICAADLTNKLDAGVSDSQSKTITIDSAALAWDELNLRGLIIHEIAHAVTGAPHGRPWQKRMEKAARHAECVGDNTLAEHLRADF